MTSGPEDAAPAPDDANDLRGFHFKRLLGRPLTWILLAIFAVAAGAAGAALVGPAVGAAAAIGTLLLGLLIVFAIADSRAEDAFFAAYAGQRGMSLSGKGPLPAATPLLRKGDDRYAERALSGPLADGVEGILALYTYEDETTDSEGNRQTNYYRYTVGLIEVPECADFVPELYCQRQVGPARPGEVRGRLPPLQRAGQAGERGARRALRDIRRQGTGPEPPAPALLPHVHRLARRLRAEEVRLRARRRHSLLLRPRPREGGRRARHDPRRLGLRGQLSSRGVPGVAKLPSAANPPKAVDPPGADEVGSFRSAAPRGTS